GVIVCGAIAEENFYIGHIYNILAKNLAMYGFHVFQFDYTGTGNSEGEFIETNVEVWIEDIRNAIKYLKQKYNIHDIILLGTRLGATTCYKLSTEIRDIVGICLWEPVVIGEIYWKEKLRELRTKSIFSNIHNHIVGSANSMDYMGYCISNDFIIQIQKIDLLKSNKTLADNVCILHSKKATKNRNIIIKFHEFHSNKRVYYKEIDSSLFWLNFYNNGYQGFIDNTLSWIKELNY
ncbi:MAG: serine aminopeptidase domain-containing protein, partial [Candidatus Thorarchaeota archaeon]